MRIAARREMHADAPGAPDADDGVSDLEQQPRAIFDFSAIAIRALVRGVLQELIEQIAVGAVNLDPVEASEPRVFRSLAKGLDDRRNLPDGEGAGYDCLGRSRLT